MHMKAFSPEFRSLKADFEAGKKIDPEPFRLSGLRNSIIEGNVFEIYNASPYQSELVTATKLRERATDSQVQFRFADKPTPDSVTVRYDQNSQQYLAYTSGVAGQNRQLGFGDLLTRSTTKEMLFAHELGHAMGVGHMCGKTLKCPHYCLKR